MTAREVEAVLRKHGFNLVSQKGSHRKSKNSAKGLQVIVPEHRGAPSRMPFV
jgi:predicted RNA binding protein YcfA (HicA-like mRNA interferase family)